MTRNRTELGSAHLVNDADAKNQVESVITYAYDRVLYWGTLEGVSRGIPTDVYETGKPVLKISWGLKETTAKTDVSGVVRTFRCPMVFVVKCARCESGVFNAINATTLCGI